jgi:hypothetical protein
MRKLYCRNCGYDLSPMFANGEESGTCPECGSLASTYFLKQRLWRRSVLRTAMWCVVIIAFAGTSLTLMAFWANPRSHPAILLIVVPAASLAGVGVAAIGFRRHVRVQAAPEEFWGFLAWAVLLGGVIGLLTQGVTTIAGIALWILRS